MKKSDNTSELIDDYISGFSPEIQVILKKLRVVIKNAAPDSIEKISYKMPAFWLNGNLVYFAAFKNHIGFYPTLSGMEKFENEIQEYKSGKGTLQFPLGKPLPYDLISRIVKFRVAENAKVTDKNKKTK
jgi:uncharacterized protein YdhG (YjbR/CyaY superfamily)